MAIITYKNMFYFHALAGVSFGLLIFFLTSIYEALYGLDLSDPDAMLMTRSSGQLLIILGLYAYTLSKSTESEVKKWASISNLIGSTIGLLFTLWITILSDWFSGTKLVIFAITIVPVYGILVLGFGYLFITKAYESS